jgi:hypothetical protein
VEIPTLGRTSVSPDATRLDVSGVNLSPGLTATVEFVFAEAPRAMVTVVVQADDGLYAGSFD